MLRSFMTNRIIVSIILCLQIIPLVIFPPSSYTLNSQEWWLPILLGVLVILSLIQLVIRRSRAAWPWYLISFAQGFNIISRLMMLLPHTTMNVEGVQKFNLPYVAIAAAAMIVSVAILWYCELPEVRKNLSA